MIDTTKRTTERFLRYVTYDTRSNENSITVPSTAGQNTLAEVLEHELKIIGVSEVKRNDNGYVYGFIPSNLEGPKGKRSIGFLAHMDTAQEVSGKNVNPSIIRYEGGNIQLNNDVAICPQMNLELSEFIGCELIVTDGTTLLGADDKAGIAEIMTMAEYLVNHPEIPHGKVCIAFTPDEEIGRGMDHFDVKTFGADVAYTVDGGKIGEIEYENFNGASARVIIQGLEIHPGHAKNKMIHSISIAEEFDRRLPQQERPEFTEGYEGYYYLTEIHGTTAQTVMEYILRDHSRENFEKRKKMLHSVANQLNEQFGNVITVEITDTYQNMREKILPHMEMIQIAEDAFETCGIAPKVIPIRGGTDGARLSYMGVPCPNLSAGGINFHSRTEFIPVQSLEKMTEVLVEIVKKSFGGLE